jgi:hypothetical protein
LASIAIKKTPQAHVSEKNTKKKHIISIRQPRTKGEKKALVSHGIERGKGELAEAARQRGGKAYWS